MTQAWTALVLNADHMPMTRFPLSVWTFERTMRNVLKDRVVVLAEHDVELHSQSLTYRPPSVVALRSYVKRPEKVAFTRMNVFLRDGFRCQYCAGEFESKDLTFDHVVPRRDGGRTGFGNIVAACVPCNTRKGSRRDMTPLRPPRTPTIHEMSRLRKLRTENFHESWIDYLYWSVELERDA
jgi:5-methylcytosine-specific restriction endonuclease McrA